MWRWVRTPVCTHDAASHVRLAPLTDAPPRRGRRTLALAPAPAPAPTPAASQPPQHPTAELALGCLSLSPPPCPSSPPFPLPSFPQP